MEKILQFFNFKKPDEVLVVRGAGEAVIDKKNVSGVEVFYFSSMVLLLVSLVFTYLYTDNLIAEHDISWRELHRSINEKNALQANIDSLEQLSGRVEEIKKEQSVIEQTIPFEPWNEQVMAFVEYSVDQIRKSTYLEMPDNISWRPVSASDVSNADLADLEIYQYSVSLKGSYEGIIQFVQSLRNSLRTLDLRSVSNFRQDQQGVVAADFNFWGYSVGGEGGD